MKVTRILPKKLAIAWQEYDLNKLQTRYEFHPMMASGFEKLVSEAKWELERLQRESK